ncbi:putative transposase number 4 of uncharacterized insertion sequence (plasmid) [Sinorhizobium fredii NGR234]|uniref:Uncharacterized protein y4jE n=1 Tax=Sinorhizobium fredii (strain NBRC 101917 / NGR234) TaxID=394 RepID=Y4JE_SINFN|nr:YecA family protein [Sinorhizobium fredii]P55505.1 RecName: Full=Uncharacterized protein y4jE [Sinorhizobium fredii NGR234]AAB91717.1 putative transposase number 4 of uncharacterized insertion sequence [Sinorhizobium fredii NGR234]
MTRPAVSYDELDEYLRGDGHNDYVGVSAIDGLIAAVVAGPVTILPDIWLPHVFGGSMPQARPGSIEERLVNTVLNRHDEVESLLRDAPGHYYPIFMNHKGKTIVGPWAIGFSLGLSLGGEAWAPIAGNAKASDLPHHGRQSAAGQTAHPAFSSGAAEIESNRSSSHHIRSPAVARHHKTGPITTQPPAQTQPYRKTACSLRLQCTRSVEHDTQARGGPCIPGVSGLKLGLRPADRWSGCRWEHVVAYLGSPLYESTSTCAEGADRQLLVLRED